MERVVTRADLYGDRDGFEDESMSLNVDQAEDIAFKDELQFIAIDQNFATVAPVQEKEEDEGFDFRLFATNPSEQQVEIADHRIRLESPPALFGEGGFVQPERSHSYYFAAAKTAEQTQDLAGIVLSGEQILTQSRQRWPGFTYSWKVTRIKMNKALDENSATQVFTLTDGPRTSRKRLGKKARIKVRVKLATVKAQREKAERENAEREILEREKRTKRNREKKVKRKAREKAKKQTGGDDAADDDSD